MQLNADLAEIEARLAGLEREIVANAQVIVTTLSKLYMGTALRDRSFDVVIVDEVSIAPLPAVYIAASLAEAHVIAIGDPKQLPPIVQAEHDAMARKWLGRDVFAVAGVTLETAAHGDLRSTLLDEQFRMHRDISIIARRYVYEGLLQDGKRNDNNDAQYAAMAPARGHALALCDTSGAQPRSSKPESGSGKYNEHHALCVVALAKEAHSGLSSLSPRDSSSSFRIGIVTPYRAQAQKIQRMLTTEQLVRDIRVGTIHTFQGLECEVVIFDTVESPGTKVWFTAGGQNTRAMRLVNVAVTRAQHKLIIVANEAYLRETLTAQDTLLLAVEEARKGFTIASTDIVSASRPRRNGQGITPAE